MLDKLSASLKNYISGSDQDDIASRREFIRREVDQCICEINGRPYPVQNWSQGGAMIFGDDRPFGSGQQVDVTMKFKLRNIIIDVTHAAQILRKRNGMIAMQYFPLTEMVKTKFQQVIDDQMAGEFAGSQI